RRQVDAERDALDAADRHRRFVTRLDDIACFLGMADARRLAPKWYAAAFRENGLDLLDPARTEQECGAWIRNHPHADALLVALAAWLTVGSPAEVTRLEEVIPDAAPRDDEVFARLQTAKLQPEVLELLARDVTILRPRTVEFLAIRLRMADRDERATDLLRRGIERYPLDARLRLRFLDLVEDRPAEEIEEAVLHLSVAVSLRPRSPAAHLKLGLALLKLGRHDDA